jgi:DNA-directed RNA polymerase
VSPRGALLPNVPCGQLALVRFYLSAAGRHLESVLFSSVLFSIFTYAEDMDELEEARLREATMSHHEIMVRFKKLFGREMTPKERQKLFLAP